MTSTHHRPALNGVDVPMLFATLDTVKAQPAAAKFQFRARNEWISGTHNRTTIQDFYGAGMEDGTPQPEISDPQVSSIPRDPACRCCICTGCPRWISRQRWSSSWVRGPGCPRRR